MEAGRPYRGRGKPRPYKTEAKKNTARQKRGDEKEQRA